MKRKRIFWLTIWFGCWCALHLMAQHNQLFPDIEMSQFVLRPTRVGKNYSTPTPGINNLLIDRNNHIWYVSTMGVSRFDGANWISFPNIGNAPTGVSTRSTYIIQTQDAHLWICHSMGYTKMNPRTFEQKHYPINYRSVEQNDYGNANGVYKIVGGIIHQDHNGQLIGRSKYGLSFYDAAADTFLTVSTNSPDFSGPPDIANNDGTFVIDTATGGIWMAHLDGICFYEYKSKRFLSEKNNPYRWVIFDKRQVPNEMTDLVLDIHGDIWFSVRGQSAVYHYEKRKNQIARYPIKLIGNGNGSMHALTMQFLTPDELMYAALNEGVFSFNIKTKKQQEILLAEGEGAPEHFVARVPSCFVTAQRDLWMTINNGMYFFPAVVRPDDAFSLNTKTQNQPQRPMHYVAALVHAGRAFSPEDMRKGVQFERNQNEIEIHIADSSAFFHFPRSCYYQISPISNEWKLLDTTQRIVLSHLAPGQYHVALKHKDADAISHITSFGIKKYWYETSWAKAIGITFLFMLLILANKWYLHRKMAKMRKDFEVKEALQYERERIAKDLHDDISSGLGAINLISKHLEKKHQGNGFDQDFAFLSSTSNTINQKMREIIWLMHTENNTLENLIFAIKKQITETFGTLSQPVIHFSTPEHLDSIEVTAQISKSFMLCVKESVHNAVKYAQAQTIHIVMQYDAVTMQFAICVKDDGVGFDEQDKLFHLGYGLKNMQHRMHSIGGTMQIEHVAGTSLTFQVQLKV